MNSSVPCVFESTGGQLATVGSQKRQSDGGAKTTTSFVIECSECVYAIVLEDGIQIFMGVVVRHVRNDLAKGRPVDNTVNVC